MTIQKELTVGQIKTMWKESSILSGGNINFTTEKILLLLENAEAKELMHKLAEAHKTIKELMAELSSVKQKNNTKTVQ